MIDLENIEHIKQLKARYFRHLDLKDWPSLKECLHEDCVAEYDGGKYSFDGADNIVQFFEQFMSASSLIFMHHGHLPEITITSENTATGVWYLQDKVINLDNDTTLEGAGFYFDKYVRTSDSEWKIIKTGYQRTFEEVHTRTNTTLNFNRFQS